MIIIEEDFKVGSRNKRIEWVDVLKGLVIMCVVAGHNLNEECGIVSTALDVWIYSFHMPLMFFLSGYVFSVKRYRGFKEFATKKIKTLIVPMIYFSLIVTVFDYLYYGIILHNANEYNLERVFRYIIGIICQTRKGTYPLIFWFIPCLFFAEIIFYWIVKLSERYSDKMIFICIVIAYTLGTLCIKFIGIMLPWCIETSFVSLLFIGIGYLYKNHEKSYNIEKSKWLYVIIFFAINMIASYFNYKIANHRIEMVYNIIGNPLLFIIETIFGIWGFVLLFKNIKGIKFIRYIGENSLLYYLLSGLMMFIPDILFYNILKVDILKIGSWNVIGALVYVIIYVITMYPVSVVINRKFKFLLGK